MVRVADGGGGGGGGGKTSQPASAKVPSYVPSKYRGMVAAAARKTGLPASVVAAQINEESGFNPHAVSSAGAEGIAQFIPGTWRTWGKGSPFDAKAAFNAYAAYMSALLKQEHGNVRNALAAYNAGPGNIQAGMGYANTILSAAHQKNEVVAPIGGSGGGGGGGGPSIANVIDDIISGFEGGPGIPASTPSTPAGLAGIAAGIGKFATALDWFFQPSHWVRIFAGIGGGLSMLTGVILLSRVGHVTNVPMVGPVSTGQATLPMGILLVGTGGVLLFVAFHNLPDSVDSLPALLGHLADEAQGKTGAAA